MRSVSSCPARPAASWGSASACCAQSQPGPRNPASNGAGRWRRAGDYRAGSPGVRRTRDRCTTPAARASTGAPAIPGAYTAPGAPHRWGFHGCGGTPAGSLCRAVRTAPVPPRVRGLRRRRDAAGCRRRSLGPAGGPFTTPGSPRIVAARDPGRARAMISGLQREPLGSGGL
jgi:hypothetical protein